MAGGNWGNCKQCKYFGSRESTPDDTESAACLQSELRKFELKVFGASGCNAWELRPEAMEPIQEQPGA